MAYIGNTQQNQSYVPAVDFFSGNGSTVAFTLSRSVGSVYEIEAVVNNVQQNPSDAYTVSGSTITFTSAPSSGTNNIYVSYTSPNTQIVQPGQGTVGNTQLAQLASLPVVGGYTATLPSQNCTLGIQGPAFSAYQGTGTTMANATSTKISFQTEEFDTNSNFDNANFRFTPTVAGYYQLSSAVSMPSFSTGNGDVFIMIYKNGSEYKRAFNFAAGVSGHNYQPIISSLVYANGTTDYFEIYAFQSSGASVVTSASGATTWFNGAMVRAA